MCHVSSKVCYRVPVNRLTGCFGTRCKKYQTFPVPYLKRVLAFADELDWSLGSNSSSIFLQNSLLQSKQ